MFFSKVEDSHGGRYSCTPYNDLGTEGPSPIIQVNIEHPPQFTMKPKSIYIQKLGESVEMTCSAMDKNTKDDRKLIMWTRKDGTGLPFGRHIVTGGNLTIENIIADDRGVYTCSAVNEAAKISIDTELVIETFSPRGPSNLTANSSQDAVTLQWTPNYIRPDLQYFIWYRLVDVTEWRTQVIMNVCECSFLMNKYIIGSTTQ